MSTKTMFIAIEGIIGAGKTTLLHELKNSHNVDIAVEPVHLWNDVSGLASNHQSKDVLAKMYHNPKRWCFSFQIWALCTRLETINASCEANVCVVERCMDSNLVFASLMNDLGHLDECEWIMYKHIHNYLKSYQPKLDAIVWLDCDVDECIARVQQRNRAGESEVTKEYQLALHQKYMCWLDTLEIPILILDSQRHDPADLALYFDNFVKTLNNET